MTQNEAILAWMQKGRAITPLEALNRFGSLRLGARIYDLRCKGHVIAKTMIAVGKKKRVARYKLLKAAR